jgi:hypothetical protein
MELIGTFIDFKIPLALGWPVAIWLIVVNNRLAKKITSVVEANTAAMVHLADKIDIMKQIRDSRDG